MDNEKILVKIRELEAKIVYANPKECAKIVHKLVKLKQLFQ